jgi:isopenicillin N synthase-like dioxygenase
MVGPNRWLPSTTIPDDIFKNTMTLYHQSMFSLALLVLEILAQGLPYGPHIFDDFISKDVVTNNVVASLRLLHYPPQTSTDERQLGTGAHTDFGAVTLLLQDENAGLQVKDEAAGVWVPVAPNKDAYVINIGDMLAMWTKGLYKSGLHRVLNRSEKDRYSVPFFFDGNMACRLAPFDGSVSEADVITVEGHMRERMETAAARGKKMMA